MWRGHEKSAEGVAVEAAVEVVERAAVDTAAAAVGVVTNPLPVSSGVYGTLPALSKQSARR
jgi:hypothetical protein